MKPEPYVQQHASESLMILYSEVGVALNNMRSVDLGTFKNGRETQPYPVSCHMLARAVADVLPGLRVVDGYYLRGNEHSWLATEDPNFIIDVYPVCTIASSPLLVYMGGISPMKDLYKPASLHTVSTTQFHKHCEMVIEAMRAGWRSLTHERENMFGPVSL